VIEASYTQSQVNIKPFFDWLGTSKSGYDWFKMHRLSDVSHLITDSEVEIKTINLPTKLSDLLSLSKSSEEEFLLFDKGIDI